MEFQHFGTAIDAKHRLPWMACLQGISQQTCAAAKVDPETLGNGASRAESSQALCNGTLEDGEAFITRCGLPEAAQHLIGPARAHSPASHLMTSCCSCGVIRRACPSP